MLEEYLKYDVSMNERITLTSDLKPLSSQPVGPWQAGAGGYTIFCFLMEDRQLFSAFRGKRLILLAYSFQINYFPNPYPDPLKN